MEEKQYLELILVPLGLLLLLAYHLWFTYQLIRHPNNTVMGMNVFNLRMWVKSILENQSKNGILAVQTLRNNIMASTMFATMSITLSSIICVFIANGWGVSSGSTTATTELGFVSGYSTTDSFKFFSILTCFLVAFMCNVQTIRYYSHGGMLINVPTSKWSEAELSHKITEYVVRAFERGSFFWSLGLRALYFAFPLFMWIFGPISMFVCCFVLVILLYYLDVSFDREREWLIRNK
ncbi:hypothetical protein ZOSMA_361G00040 [Zostera marina]|uniref:DUF599 domain-containing protein n=1 Tax=Zostera marina TaxID=29655 RepID=A0A0K9P685_ZOSMR|nr:hypothetical protein ZOSMA_361G00040 [Zostera marina]